MMSGEFCVGSEREETLQKGTACENPTQSRGEEIRIPGFRVHPSVVKVFRVKSQSVLVALVHVVRSDT